LASAIGVVRLIFFVNSATDAGALLLVHRGRFSSVLGKPQRDALPCCCSIRTTISTANAIFWGLWLIPFGLLVYRSGFLPRFLGVWLMTACLAWLAFSITGLLFPGQEGKVYTLTQPFTLGEW
jgi:Domain of unknown function (DUF4386)